MYEYLMAEKMAGKEISVWNVKGGKLKASEFTAVSKAIQEVENNDFWKEIYKLEYKLEQGNA